MLCHCKLKRLHDCQVKRCSVVLPVLCVFYRIKRDIDDVSFSSRLAGMLRSTLTILLLMLLLCAVDTSAAMRDVFVVSNRIGRDIPNLVVRLTLHHSTMVSAGHSRPDGHDIRITQCSNGASIPFYLETASINTDSATCWVRMTNMPAAGTVTLIVDYDTTRTNSASNGVAVFDLFDEFTSPSASSTVWNLPTGSFINNGVLTPSGALSGSQYVLWKGAHTVQDRAAIIESRIRATAQSRGSMIFFAANTDAKQGYSIDHDAIPGANRSNVYRIDGTSVTPLTASNTIWDPGEWIRYTITLFGDSATIIRASERNTAKRDTIRVALPDQEWVWQTLGFAAQPGYQGSFVVDWVRVRPRIDVEPIVTQQPSSVVVTPPSATICNGTPVVLGAPTGWKTYRWSNGSTNRTTSVNTPASISLTMTGEDGCVLQLGPFPITSGQQPNGGSDTTFSLCLGKKVTLTANSGYASYRWLIGTGQRQSLVGSGSNRLEIDSADIYYCIITSSSGCPDTVVYRVNRVYDASASVASSTGGNQMCIGDTVTLFALPPLSSFRWFKNGVPLSETRGSLQISEPGKYEVQVRIGDSANACVSMAEITMEQRNRVAMNLPASLDICEGDTATLDAGDGFTTYTWSSGQDTRFIRVHTSGTYSLHASVNGACKDSAAVVVRVRPAPYLAIRSVDGRTSMCDGERLELELDSTVYPIRWNTGDTLRRIRISTPGVYSATVDYPNGCMRTSTITIANGVMTPVIVALDNQAICDGESTRLTTSMHYHHYHWSTGDTTDTIIVAQVGTYTVEVMLFECKASSSIIIDRANPLGPRVQNTDTVSVCEVHPGYPLRIENEQLVPRTYTVLVSGRGFSVGSTSVTVSPSSSIVVPVLYDGSQGTGLQIANITMSDACGWQSSFDVAIDYGAKTAGLSWTSTALNGLPPRAGGIFKLSLNIINPTLFTIPRPRDSVRILLTYDPLYIHLPSGTHTVRYGTVTIDDSSGSINATVTPFIDGLPQQILEFEPEALIAPELSTQLRINSIENTNPCVTITPTDSVYTMEILPYGCEVSTIGWSTAPRLAIRHSTSNGVLLDVDSHGSSASIHVADVLGRIAYSHTCDSSHGVTTVWVPATGHWPYFIIATNDAGSSVIRFIPEVR